MTAAGRIVVDAGRSGGLESELVARLAELGLEAAALPRGATAADKRALLAAATMLISLYPDGPDALLCIGMAVGSELPTMVLADTVGPDVWPPGVAAFATLQHLIDAVPPGPDGRLVDERRIARLKLPPDFAAWHRRRYPTGIRSTEWTLDEQISALGDGGAALLKGAFDTGLFPQHPMTGTSLAAMDLTGLRLNKAEFAEAKLAKSRMTRSDLIDPDLGGADLAGADLTGASLVRATLDGATMSDAILDGAVIDRSTLRDLVAPRLSASHLRVVSSSFAGANMVDARFVRAAFRDVDLSGADLSGVDATGAQFRRCHFAGAALAGMVLDRAVLLDCVIEGARDGDAALAAAHVVQATHFARTSGQPRTAG